VVPIELPMLDFRGTPVSPSDACSHLEPSNPTESADASADISNTLDSTEGAPPTDAFNASNPPAGAAIKPSHPANPASQLKEHFFLVAEDKVRLYSSLRGCCRTLSAASADRVLAVSDRVLGLPPGAPEAVVATGGMDKVVRLWTLGGRRKGEQRLVCSLRGHGDAVSFLSVARYEIGSDLSFPNTCQLWKQEDRRFGPGFRTSFCLVTSNCIWAHFTGCRLARPSP
jgi:hypothetical protein